MYIFLNGDFNSRTAKDLDFIYIENNNDNIDFFELSDVNSVNILESLNIHVGRINKDSVKNHNGSRLLDLCKGNDLFIINGRIENDKVIGMSKPNQRQ
jgi:hypothetical protein